MVVGEKVWYVVEVSAEQGALEAVEYALMEAGALGTAGGVERAGARADASSEMTRVSGYFDELPGREFLREKLLEALRIYGAPTSAVRGMEFREVADRDWLGEWKKGWQPSEVGGRFVIAPPWAEVNNAGGRVVIRIEPGMAFGTGTHETTRLCLAAVERYFHGGSFLDVGTGTGVLAIAAAKLSAGERVAACDTDAEAIAIARENARLNGVSERISFRVGTVEETTASADFVCANLTADVITPLLPALLGATCGRLILSGILDTQAETVVGRLRELGVAEPTEISAEGEWVAIII
jgi:ribosomal protein L11 methyltransferase